MSDPKAFPKPPSNLPSVIEEADVAFILKQTLRPENHDNVECLRFIAGYLNCRDVRQASLMAGIAGTRGAAFMRRRDVVDAIQAVTATAVLKHGLDPSAIVERVKEVTEVDPADIFNPDGTCKENMNDIPPHVRRAIKKFKVKNLFDFDQNGVQVLIGRMVEVEMWDKLKASELLGRETDLFKETKIVKHDATENMKSILLGSEKRAEESAAMYRDVSPALPPVIEVRKVLDVGPQSESDQAAGRDDTNSNGVVAEKI